MNTFIQNCLKPIVFATVILLLFSCASTELKTEAPAVDSVTAIPPKNITIALLGATGMVGGFVLQEALAQGYSVKALARTPAKLAAFNDQITIVQGDALDPVALEQWLNGSDVIISALGPVKADGSAADGVSTTVTGHIIGLMPRHNIKRYIVVSGAAVDVPGDDRNLKGRVIQTLATITLKSTVEDKQAEYQLLAASDIEWTLVRCPLITAKSFEHQALATLDTPHHLLCVPVSWLNF
ncbi:NAD(P)-dependent oxidoreductase [Oceanicoccus sp. KOV_DT_Chl]|uniref:NAD(P)-dependent oxidoreductase n=1 Tax=Oceanicoccus sp. KOV_DT_Chl TaxID=1904639 RepID=UPI0011AEF230|nr:NAD(P)H-binding protein [Oceanicoccus sp. KOV_DT_Chl]